MLSRWFAAPRASAGSNGGNDDDSPPKDPDYIVLPPAASDSWRTWLKTGMLRRIHFPAAEQVAQGVVVLAAGVVAASVLAGHPPSPAQLTRVDGSTGGAVSAPSTGTPIAPGTNSLPVPSPAVPALPTSLPAGVKVPSVPLPVTLPTPTPILPTPPTLPGI